MRRLRCREERRGLLGVRVSPASEGQRKCQRATTGRRKATLDAGTDDKRARRHHSLRPGVMDTVTHVPRDLRTAGTMTKGRRS